jgi:serine/threonine protein kinase
MSTDQLFADRYRLERRLGVGGMATVQLAFDTRLERYVAVKLLAEHLAEDSSFVSRFRREALAAARLVHPNIVQVFDFGSDTASDRQFIVMEYVDGQSCAEILRDRGPLGTRDAVDILGQACRGLDYAHRNGVVHRDVKPGNLLRNTDGVVKLADFGIAKAAEQSDITKAGSVLGTAAYLAPEQARGEPAAPAADLYALGVVAYQLMAGRLPYDAGSITDLARQQDAGPPPRLDELNRDVPSALADAVARALARTPAGRYADAAEMEDALRDGLSGVAPGGPDAEATRAIAAETDATRMLTGTRSTPPVPRERPRTRRLEPLAEEPRRVPPPRARRAAPPPPPRRSGARAWVALLLVLALVAGVVGVYEVAGQGAKKPVETKSVDTGAAVPDAAQQLKSLIDTNTR